MASDPSVRDLWRLRVCKDGICCQHPNCVFAHRLCELRAPNELYSLYNQACVEGVDRFGQDMKPAQLQLIKEYYYRTPDREVPPWVCGLRYVYSDEILERDRYMQWDYGLTLDLELLCHHREGPLPFVFLPRLWTILQL